MRGASFDHLVGAGEYRRRNFDAERPSGLEIDHQFVFGRSLHRKVRWLGALEDAIDVAGGAPVQVDGIRPVGDQATIGDEGAAVVNCGQFVPGCKRDDQVAMNDRQRAPRQDYASVRGAREGRNSALDLAGIAHVDRTQLNTERWRHRLERAHWPVPEAIATSRMTAARVTRGAISLSSSSHFAPMPYSNPRNPVTLPPGRARLS